MESGLGGTAARMMALFSGSERAHGTHSAPTEDGSKWAIKTTANTVKEPVTLKLWELHLKGARPLGIIPVRGDRTCLWASIDVDEYGGDHAALVGKVYELGLPLVPCVSKSGGLHLFLFLIEPASAAAVQGALRDVAVRRLKLPGSTEIFPKQVSVGEDGLGNWMCMPYLGTTYGGKLREQAGVKRGGAAMTAEEFVDAAERLKVGPDALVTLGKPRSTEKALVAMRMPPCLEEACARGIGELRNETLFNVGVFLRKRSPSSWVSELHKANVDHVRPPLPEDEIKGLILSLKKKEGYDYKREILADECHDATCPMHGGRDGYPVLVRRVKTIYQGEPSWTYEFAQGKLEDLTTDQVRNYNSIANLALERLSADFMPMTQARWIELCMKVPIEEVRSDDDTGREDIFKYWLHDFLTNRQTGSSVEDLLSGRPWLDEERRRHYFTMPSLIRFLVRERALKDGDQRERRWVAGMIRKMGGDGGRSATLRAGKKKVRAWFVPQNGFEEP